MTVHRAETPPPLYTASFHRGWVSTSDALSLGVQLRRAWLAHVREARTWPPHFRGRQGRAAAVLAPGCDRRQLAPRGCHPVSRFFFFLPQHLVRFSSSRCGVCGIANSGQVVTGRTKEWSPSVWSEARARFNCARNEVVRPCGAVDKSNYFAVALLFGSIISVCPY